MFFIDYFFALLELHFTFSDVLFPLVEIKLAAIVNSFLLSNLSQSFAVSFKLMSFLFDFNLI